MQAFLPGYREVYLLGNIDYIHTLLDSLVDKPNIILLVTRLYRLLSTLFVCNGVLEYFDRLCVMAGAVEGR